MRLVTWNMDRAGTATDLSAAKWTTLLGLSPDIATLQEVTDIPSRVLDDFDVKYVAATLLDGVKANFGTAMLVKKPDWKIASEVPLKSGHEWVNRIQKTFSGWLVAHQVEHISGDRYSVVSVHSPAFPFWPTDSELIGDIMDDADWGRIKLKAAKKLWFTEILWSLLRDTKTCDGSWIVAGDFNAAIQFDIPKPRGNVEIIKRMNCLGLWDCVSRAFGGLNPMCPVGEPEPTFRPKAPKDAMPIHQLDYVYVNPSLLACLGKVLVVRGARPTEPGVNMQHFQRISDHFPVVCDFGRSR